MKTKADPVIRDWRLLTSAIVALIGVAAVVAFQAVEIRQTQARITAARERYRTADRLMALLSNAETGQRGFLLTGSAQYLAPYKAAQGKIPEALTAFLALDPSPLSQEVAGRVRQKMDELGKTIELFQSGQHDSAMQVVKTDFGNAIMAKLRDQIGKVADGYYAEAAAERRHLTQVDQLLTWFSLCALSVIAAVLTFFAIRMRRTLRDNDQLTTELREGGEAYRQLAVKLQSIREDERAEIARELHDELGQSLTGIKMEIAGAKLAALNGSTETFTKKLAGATADADEAIRSMRRLATQLRPPQLDHLGLVDAVEVYAEEFGARSGVEVKVSLPQAKLPLNESQNTALFRIVQESLTNVARHAKAKTVAIKGELQDDEFRLSIADDGVGLSEERRARSLGVLGMTERARSIGGQLNVDSAPGSGTRVRVRLPVVAVKTQAL